jgi:RNA polymerase sigma-54 factor
MIENEDPQNPLSDSQIAEKLKEKFGIDISRRTVVKYRKILGIPQIEERRKKIRSP